MIRPICNIDIGELCGWITAQEDSEPELADGAAMLRDLKAWIDQQQPVITDARCGNCGAELFNPAVTDEG
jgi:hypothetical protein